MMRIRIVTFLLLAALVGTMTLAACGGDGDADADSEPPATSTPTGVASDGRRWLAAVEVAPKADDLDAATERLRDALGTAMVVSPTACFEGLPAEAGDGYVIGATAGTSDDAVALVEDAGDEVLFTAFVTILCTD
jgi:hypothetical protein